MSYGFFLRFLDSRAPGLIGVALTLSLSGCSTAGTEASGSSSDSATESSQTANPSTSGGETAGTSPLTSSGGSDTGSESQGGSTEAGTSDADTGTTLPATNETTTNADPTTGGTTIGETTSETTSPTTGGNFDFPCETDADCVLVDDCCSCSAAHVDEDPSVCDEECMVTVCQSFEIKEAVCEFGQCVPARTNCDDSQILCDALPPECEPGFVPGVEANNSCWTGLCVPAILCNFVPDCQDCAGYDDYFCATDVTQLGFKPHCELLPPECNGQATCECAGEVCEAPYDQCADGDNGPMCNCPVC